MHEGNKVRILALLAAAALTAGGCLSNQGEQWLSVDQAATGGGDVTLYRNVSFPDIPIPPEFILLSNESYSFQGSHFRTGVFKYTGKIGWTWTLDYFRNEIPAYGWTLEKTDRGFADRAMTFSKGPERMIAVIRQIRNGTGLEIQLDNIEQNDLLLKGKLADE